MTTRKIVFAILACAAGALSLSGCGFTPLYGNHGVASSPGVVEDLSKISIRQINDRQGMRLRQVLREELQPLGAPEHPLYDLDVTLSTRVQELGIQKDATSSRANLILAASFYLNKGAQRQYGDRIQVIVSYNILDDQYATVAAQSDAEERAIREAGIEIRTRLAVFFSDQEKKRNSAGAK